MAHPHHAHRDHKVQHRRVHHITHGMARASGGYAHGGFPHDDADADLAMLHRHVKKAALRADGGRVKHRADKPRRASGGKVFKVHHKEQKGQDDLQPGEGAADDTRSMHRARGGRTKSKGHTTVNVMVAHPRPSPGGAAPSPAPTPPIGLGAAPPPVAPPVAPPMAAPPMARPPMLPPGGMPPPGLPPRRSGGRVQDGAAYMEGKRHRPVDHAPGKQDTPDVGRGKVITYARGGRVEHPKKQPKGPGGFGLHAMGKGQGGLEDRGSGSAMSGGLEPPITRGSGGNEAPRHPRMKTRVISSEKGPMGPNFHAGGGGGMARLRKAAKAKKFSQHVAP